MNKKDVLELKRRYKKESCTINRLAGCYVDGNKHKVLKLNEDFLNMKEEEFYKFMEIAKKTLTGTIGNNIIELDFPTEEENPGGKQQFLYGLRASGLDNEDLLDRLYDLIIDGYQYVGNYLILVFHDTYDVMTKTTDNMKLDESEEVYEYLLVAICPVSLSKAGLGYRADENRIGVDVGGTTVKIGYFDLEGNIIDKWEIPTRTEDEGKNIIPDIAGSIMVKMTQNDITKKDIIGVGIGVPGPVKADGTVLVAVNLGWGKKNPNEELGELLGVPVKTANDANVAALGEMWRGGGQGHEDVVAVTLGTGVGGGIIIGGKMVAGSNGAGGEIGHIHLEDNETEQCGCKGYGCLEQYASATGIVRLAKKKLADSSKDSVLRSEEVTAKAVWDAVKEDDVLAKEVAEIYGQYLGKGLAAVANTVNPEVFVIGGGVSKAGRVVIDYMEPYFQKYAFPGAKNAKFVLAKLGNDAGMYGAARLVLDK